MSKTLAGVITGFARAVTLAQNSRRRVATLAGAAHRLQPVFNLETDRGMICFSCPTARASHDPIGFGKDEPDTIAWLRDEVQGGTLWDIGANVGTYALFAALLPSVRVVALEPSGATFSALVRNIEINGLGDRIQPFCIALDESSRVAALHMAHSEAGHSMHAFGVAHNVLGDIKSGFAQATLGFTMDQLAAFPGVWSPDYVKLDVDSIEAQILRGGIKTMQKVRSIIVEVVGEGEGNTGPLGVLESQGFIENLRYREFGGRNRVFSNPRFTASA